MVWLTWRQHRMQVLLTMAFVAVVGGLLVARGSHTADLIAGLTPDSERFTAAMETEFVQVRRVLTWLGVVPALIGLFWGAPLLAREYERGTHRLAWTQSMSRRAWLGVKLAGLGAVVVLAGLAFGAVMNAWVARFATLPHAVGRLNNEDLFVSTGILPAAWWLFAFVLGAAAGAVLRKTLPAMAVTIAVLAVAYLSLFATDARQHYATPTRVEQANPVVHGEGGGYINTPSGAVEQLPKGAMLVTSGWFDTTGRVLPSQEMWACATTSDYLACMADHDYRWFAEYHAADQYWRFQLTEGGILLIATLALGGVVVHQVRRRGA